MVHYEEETKLEANCIARNWTLVRFNRVYIDEIFDRLMDSLNSKYCIIPSFDRGYDDPLTSKIYFENSNDAGVFKVFIKDVLTKTIGYFQFAFSEEDGTVIAIVEKKFWDDNNCLNGDGLDDETEEALPDGIYAIAECCYEHVYDRDDEASLALINAGFTERTDLI